MAHASTPRHPLPYVVEHSLGGVFDAYAARIDHQFRVCGRLVGIADTGKLLDFATPGLRIQPFHVAALADLDRRTDIHLDEVAAHPANEIPRLLVGRHKARHHEHPMLLQFAGEEPDASHVRIPFGTGEAGIGKERANAVAIQMFHLESLGAERRRHLL